MNKKERLKKLNIKKEDFRLVIGRSKIDYDLNKEAINRKKHKYSLESAVHILTMLLLQTDHTRFITRGPFKVKANSEWRHEHMTIDDSQKVVFIVTTMCPDETVRVISFRRASAKERVIFHQYTGYNESSLV